MSVKYYSKAIKSPLGQQVRDFYTRTSKQVVDIHEEARRIASEQKEKAAADAKVSKPVEESKVSEPVEPKADAAAPSKSDL